MKKVTFREGLFNKLLPYPIVDFYHVYHIGEVVGIVLHKYISI